MMFLHQQIPGSHAAKGFNLIQKFTKKINSTQKMSTVTFQSHRSRTKQLKVMCNYLSESELYRNDFCHDSELYRD